MRRFFTLLLCVWCLAPVKVQAEPGPEIQALQMQVQQLTKTVQDLQLIVQSQGRELESMRVQREPVPAVAGAPQAPRFGQKILPEIGVVADTALKLDSPKTDGEGADRLSVREIELVLGGNVDPYSRLDSTLAFTEEEGVELEEAYLTRFELPLETTARIGRFKPRLGKALALHRDSLDTVDEPLVVQRYFGVEGMSKTGVDLTKLLDLPLPTTHQVTVGVLEGGRGEDGTAFGETKRRPTVYAHLKNYVDLNDGTNLEIGFSDAVGSRDADASFEVNVFGLDATLMHHFDANRALKLQAEAFNVDRSESSVEVEDPDTAEVTQQDIDGNVWGAYFLADLRLSPQWAAGLRLDAVEPVDNPIGSLEKRETGVTGYLTFYQSEFARWRVQVSRFELTDGSDDNQVLLQGTFSLGEHKHKLQ